MTRAQAERAYRKLQADEAKRRIERVTREDVERLGRAMLARGLAPKVCYCRARASRCQISSNAASSSGTSHASATSPPAIR